MGAFIPRISNRIDWRQLYAALEQLGGIPAASATEITGTRALFRAPFLDLAEVRKRIDAAGVGEPQQTVLYVDVLEIPGGFTWFSPDTTLSIYARRIEAAASARIRLDNRSGRNAANLLLFTNELPTPLTVVAVSADIPVQITNPPPQGGLNIRTTAGAPARIDLTKAQGVPLTPPPAFVDMLRNSFIFASLLYDMEPDIALAKLIWIKEWGAASPVLLDFFLRSCPLVALLRAQIDAAKNGAVFVPYLTRHVYTTLATAFVAEAKRYESNYRLLAAQSVVTQNFIQQARALRDNQLSQTQYVDALAAQARTNYDNAVAAAESARRTFDRAKSNAEMAEINFRYKGIPAWRIQQITDALIELASAAVTFGVGVGTMLVGNPAGGAAGVGSAVQGANAVANAAGTAADVATMARLLADVMERLGEITEALQKIYEFARAVMIAVQNIGNAGSVADTINGMDIDTGGVDLTATYEWQIYQLRATAALEMPVSLGVDYARDLQLAVDEVSIYGQALAAAQLAVITAGQEYAAIRLKQELAVEQHKRLQSLIDDLVEGQKPTDALMQEFYQRYIDAKSSLFSALQGYRASFFYWALRHSSVNPRIIDGVDTLDAGLKDLTAIALDEANALNNFSPPPQVMRQRLVTVTDPAVLNRLRTEGTTSFSVTLDDPAFVGLSRNRLTRVRVWLESARSIAANNVVQLAITTPGSYLDRFQGLNYQFVSSPLQRGFHYRVSATRQRPEDWVFGNGTYGYVEIDGAVDQEVSFAYFVPTPLAEWRIASPQGVKQDFSGVTKIILEFAGSVIPRV
jgi:hypothetical protein